MRCCRACARANWCRFHPLGIVGRAAAHQRRDRPGDDLRPDALDSQYAADARVGPLVNPVVDPISGEPEFKHTPARVAPFVVAWQGFVA